MPNSTTGFSKAESGARNKREAREGDDGNERRARAGSDGKEKESLLSPSLSLNK